MKILIIEDSERLRRSLSRGFSELGYSVDSAADGRAGLNYARSFEYEVIVLDIMLPVMDGISVLKALRDARVQSNIIILSAKDQIEDRIKGLNLGADDYVCKPFSFDELHARVLTLIRRGHLLKSNIIAVKNLTVDIQLKQVSVLDNIVQLTPLEYSLLVKLAINLNKVISSRRLAENLYDSDLSISKNSIEVHISSIRKKLKAAGVENIIETRRSFGYVINT